MAWVIEGYRLVIGKQAKINIFQQLSKRLVQKITQIGQKLIGC